MSYEMSYPLSPSLLSPSFPSNGSTGHIPAPFFIGSYKNRHETVHRPVCLTQHSHSSIPYSAHLDFPFNPAMNRSRGFHSSHHQQFECQPNFGRPSGSLSTFPTSINGHPTTSGDSKWPSGCVFFNDLDSARYQKIFGFDSNLISGNRGASSSYSETSNVLSSNQASSTRKTGSLSAHQNMLSNLNNSQNPVLSSEIRSNAFPNSIGPHGDAPCSSGDLVCRNTADAPQQQSAFVTSRHHQLTSSVFSAFQAQSADLSQHQSTSSLSNKPQTFDKANSSNCPHIAATFPGSRNLDVYGIPTFSQPSSSMSDQPVRTLLQRRRQRTVQTHPMCTRGTTISQKRRILRTETESFADGQIAVIGEGSRAAFTSSTWPPVSSQGSENQASTPRFNLRSLTPSLQPNHEISQTTQTGSTRHISQRDRVLTRSQNLQLARAFVRVPRWHELDNSGISWEPSRLALQRNRLVDRQVSEDERFARQSAAQFTREEEDLQNNDYLEATTKNGKDSECGICFNKMTTSVSCKGCKQSIGCKSCVQSWIRTQAESHQTPNCPLCRRQIGNVM